MLILLFLVIIILVLNSQLVICGAISGLTIWFNDIVPILLPFIITSNFFMLYFRTKISYKASIISTILIGSLCGFPIGAKITCDMVNNGCYNRKVAQIILPFSNNFSPMFISGYISYILLNNKYSLILIFTLIYLPYLIISFSLLSLIKLKNKNYSDNLLLENKLSQANINLSSPNDMILQAIQQITVIGVFIMIFCIIIKFVQTADFLSENFSSIICSLLEYSCGIRELSNSHFNDKIKTALIIALASFGGFSSIYQTNFVIQKNGLSIIKYSFTKAICATLTYYLALLFI